MEFEDYRKIVAMRYGSYVERDIYESAIELSNRSLESKQSEEHKCPVCGEICGHRFNCSLNFGV